MKVKSKLDVFICMFHVGSKKIDVTRNHDRSDRLELFLKHH